MDSNERYGRQFPEWLAKFNEDEHDELDDIEQQVLFNMEAQLESVLTEPLEADYKAAVERAKEQLKGE